MTKRTLVSVILAVVIVAMLGGGYAIVVYNTSATDSQSDVPSGFIH
jgi:hypothetical protein